MPTVVFITISVLLFLAGTVHSYTQTRSSTIRTLSLIGNSIASNKLKNDSINIYELFKSAFKNWQIIIISLFASFGCAFLEGLAIYALLLTISAPMFLLPIILGILFTVTFVTAGLSFGAFIYRSFKNNKKKRDILNKSKNTRLKKELNEKKYHLRREIFLATLIGVGAVLISVNAVNIFAAIILGMFISFLFQALYTFVYKKNNIDEVDPNYNSVAKVISYKARVYICMIISAAFGFAFAPTLTTMLLASLTVTIPYIPALILTIALVSIVVISIVFVIYQIHWQEMLQPKENINKDIVENYSKKLMKRCGQVKNKRIELLSSSVSNLISQDKTITGNTEILVYLNELIASDDKSMFKGFIKKALDMFRNDQQVADRQTTKEYEKFFSYIEDEIPKQTNSEFDKTILSIIIYLLKKQVVNNNKVSEKFDKYVREQLLFKIRMYAPDEYESLLSLLINKINKGAGEGEITKSTDEEKKGTDIELKKMLYAECCYGIKQSTMVNFFKDIFKEYKPVGFFASIFGFSNSKTIEEFIAEKAHEISKDFADEDKEFIYDRLTEKLRQYYDSRPKKTSASLLGYHKYSHRPNNEFNPERSSHISASDKKYIDLLHSQAQSIKNTQGTNKKPQ